MLRPHGKNREDEAGKQTAEESKGKRKKKRRDKPRVESDKWRKSARRWWCTRQPRSRSRTKWRKRRGAMVFFSGGGLVTAATRRWCGGGGDRRQRLAVWVVQIRAPFEGGVEMAMGPFTVFPQ